MSNIKKILIMLSVLALTVGVTSCQIAEMIGKDETTGLLDVLNNKTPETTTAAVSEETTTAYIHEEHDPVEKMDFINTANALDYINLGNYKGLSVTVEAVKVKDEDVENAIDEILTNAAKTTKITDRVTQKGDVVNMDYKGFMNGEQFAGGTASGQTITLSENSGFIPGFAEGLVGVMPGTTVTLDITFPTNYYEELAGKPVKFDVTVNYIEGEPIIPEFNDEFVVQFTGGDYKTVADFREYLKNAMTEENKSKATAEAVSTIWQRVIEASEVKEYPEQQVLYYYYSMLDQYSAYAEQYQVDLDTILSIQGETRDSLREKAKEYVKEDLVFYSIVKNENITVGDDVYNEMLAGYAANAGTTPEYLEAYYGKDMLSDNMLWDNMLTTLNSLSNVEIK